MRHLSQLVFTLTLLFTLLLTNDGSSLVLAQGIIIDPPPGGPPPEQPLLIDPIRIEQQRVDVVIDGPLTQVYLTQVLRNHSAQSVEGTYVFPLPENAAIGDFQMTVDGQVVEGQVLSKEEARRAYEAIVRQRRDPALLEYLGRDLFQVRVFPIPPGATRKLELSYSQILTKRDGLYQFDYPVKVRQYTAEPIGSFDLNISIRNQPGLRTIYSPNYAITVERTSDASAEISYHAADVRPEHDFSLYFGAAESDIGLNILSYQPAGEDGYFVLLATPGIEVDATAVIARDIVMIVDISGSMQGEKFKQAQAAAHYVVDHLNDADRFNLIAFSTGVRLWQSQLQPLTNDGLQSAHDWIDQLTATGSTDINRALLEGLAQLEDDQAERPAYVLFLTDGLPTQGETEIDRILTNARNNRPEATQIRLFAFGLGYDVNTQLLDTLSRELNGRSSYVQPNERIDEEVSHFYAGISTPVLSNVTLEFGNNAVIDEMYPYPLPDLFAGEQLVVAGRYRAAKPVTVTLRGKSNGKQIVYHYPAQRFATTGGEPAVARLWAARKISALLDQVRLAGPQQELIDAIVELSLHYGIITPYTSLFVPEPALVTGGGEPRQGGREDNDETGGEDGSGPPLVPLADEALSRERMERSLSAQIANDAYDTVGQKAVEASEGLNELASASVIQNSQEIRYLSGRAFVQRKIAQMAENQQLTLWVDTLYTDAMQLETVQFGSDCYFALAKEPQLTAWLALASDIIIVRDAKTALHITTTPTTLQDQTCAEWRSEK